MYSEDTQEDFNTMDRQKQEALLKRTWMEREKEFYGEEIDEEPDMIIEEAEDCSDSDDDIARGVGDRNDIVEDIIKEEQNERNAQISISESNTGQRSHFQIMKEKQAQMQELESQLKQKQRHIEQLSRKLQIKKAMGADLTPEGANGF